MSSPLRRTLPSTLALGIVSCMRFRQRINVDLPQPDGPMIAETACSSKSNVMSSIAFFGPYHADTWSVRIFAAIASSPRDGTKPDHDPRHDRNAEHHEDEAQRLLGGPGDERNHDRRQGDDSRRRTEDESLAHDPRRAELEDKGEREDADHDGGNLGHDIDEEPDRGAEAILPVLGQIDPGQDADRECDHGGEGGEGERALERVSGAALGRREREETPSDGAESADGGLEEEAPERDRREDDAAEGRDVPREILPPPPGVPVEPEPHAAPSPRRRTRPSMSRAKMLMRSDISMRTSPSSMRALSSSGSVAFRKLFAIQLAMVCPWSKREMEIALRFPIVIVTAIVSPTARPRPRMTAPKIPDRKSTRLNSSHSQISYAVFCLKKKKNKQMHKLTL